MQPLVGAGRFPVCVKGAFWAKGWWIFVADKVSVVLSLLLVGLTDMAEYPYVLHSSPVNNSNF